MARTTYVKKARLTYTCEKCGNPIYPGMPYKHVTPRPGRFARGFTRRRCATCPSWSPSELTFSKMGPIYDAQAAFDVSNYESAEDVTEALNSIAETVREVADEYIQSADNMESGFGHATSPSDELRQKGDDLNAWADEIEGVTVPDPLESLIACDDCEDGVCPTCNAEEPQVTTCTDCDGSGQCSTCNGDGNTGEVNTSAWLAEVENTCSIVNECPV